MDSKHTGPAFQVPNMSEVANLMVERMDETTLKPDTPVICINRGVVPQQDTWDGHHVTIPPGLFRTEYGAAQHFQRRLIVKGTRNVEVGGHVSWIGIIGTDDGRRRVDPPDLCEPFTEDELRRFGEKVEAIDREALGDKVVAVPVVGNRIMRGAGTLRPQIAADRQATDAASAAAEHVFDRNETSLTKEDEAAAALERGGGGDEPAPPKAPPMRRRG